MAGCCCWLLPFINHLLANSRRHWQSGRRPVLAATHSYARQCTRTGELNCKSARTLSQLAFFPGPSPVGCLLNGGSPASTCLSVSPRRLATRCSASSVFWVRASYWQQLGDNVHAGRLDLAAARVQLLSGQSLVNGFGVIYHCNL